MIPSAARQGRAIRKLLCIVAVLFVELKKKQTKQNMISLPQQLLYRCRQLLISFMASIILFRISGTALPIDPRDLSMTS